MWPSYIQCNNVHLNPRENGREAHLWTFISRTERVPARAHRYVRNSVSASS